VSLRRIDATPPAPPSYVGAPMTVTRATFVAFEARWGSHDMETKTWHPAPFAQTVVMLRGTLTIATTSGEVRHFGPGDAIRVEDTAPCRGHISVAGDEPVSVQIAR
jgi:quercetin dioxygenase-like cupin family protein